MAAIEKICELSGEYPGWLMYGYKHNQLQIMPKYRKLFRGKNHVLVISKSGLRQVYKGGGTSSFNSNNKWFDENYRYINNRFNFKTFKGTGWYEWIGHRHYDREILKKIKITQEYNFVLYCPELQGDVNGFYHNSTMNISTVKRKLKRLMGGKLNIVYTDAIDDRGYPDYRKLEEVAVQQFKAIYENN